VTRKPASVRALEDFGRIRLSAHFFMRDFLHSEISQITGIPNIPDDPDLAIAAGTRLCEDLLEPLNASFGRIAIRSALRCEAVNAVGAANGNQFNCSANPASYANHIWDRRDAAGCMGAMATVVVPWFLDHHDPRADWRSLAWWIHDHLPYSDICFFPKLAAFNLGWHERPRRRITSYIPPRGLLTAPGMANHHGSHAEWYSGFPD
jgi:hypothetical protein